MRPVLPLIDSFNQGGAERQAIQLARLLRESGRYRVLVASLNGDGVLRPDVDRLGLDHVPEYRLTSFYDANAIRQAARFARFLRRERVGILQTHGFYTNVFGMVGAALARVPIRLASKLETEGVRTIWQARVERRVYAIAHAVVVNAEAVRGKLVREGLAERKIVTIYNGVDLGRFAPPSVLRREEALSALGLPRTLGGVVTIVANLRLEVKDHPTFLRAARRVCVTRPDASFVVAGEGELTEKTKALARELGVERNTYFIGRCGRVPELLSVSDVCVLSSKAEGFSNSVLEYMAAGRPVVATDVGGAQEAVADGVTGYLVAAGDDERMADRITSLLANPAVASAMGERGRKLVAERFSCEIQLSRTEELYDALLGAVAGCR
jgi:glycosyltransferase involved in cell wall biosynthesis